LTHLRSLHCKVMWTLVLLLVGGSQTAAQESYPNTTTFMNALTVCALNLRIEISGNLQGSITNLYEGIKTNGDLNARFQSDFVSLFPGADRANAYQIYTQCVTSLLSAKSKTIEPEYIPKITAQLVPSVGPAVVRFYFSNATPTNVGYSQHLFFATLDSCQGNIDIKKFRTRLSGPGRPYDPERGWMEINESDIVMRWFHLIEAIRVRRIIPCIATAAVKILYRIDFDNEEGDHFTRYFLGDFTSNSQVPGQTPQTYVNQASYRDLKMMTDTIDSLHNESINLMNLEQDIAQDIAIVRQAFR